VSLTGPGCEHCNFTGRTTFPNAFNQKPCDACGGLSLLGPLPTKRVDDVFADAFLDQLDAHGAENCLEFGFYTSRGVHISVELRRHDGKTMAMLRDEQIARAENAERELEAALSRANKLHRRAQRLEGIEQRMETLRASHARELEGTRAEYERRLTRSNLRENSLSVRVAEAEGTLPPAEKTATRLDNIADRITADGRCAAYVNVKLIAQYIRIAAATIRTIEWERAFDRNHELCAKANESTTAIGAGYLRELNAANATIAELRAELETLRAQAGGMP
jgi:hypothetical protein